MLRRLAPLAVLAAFFTPALANDSVATLGTGGLVLANAPDIVMAKENLFISTDLVTVDYIFHNKAKATQTHVVAFPMPQLGPEAYADGDLPFARDGSPNFIGFTVTANGQPITPLLEQKAFAGGEDITAFLTERGIPLHPLSREAAQALDRLTPLELQEVADSGAIVIEDGNSFIRWSLKSTYYWEQAFPAGQDIAISHRYTPASGTWFYDPGMLDDAALVARYCIDDGTRRAIRRGTPDGRDMVLAHEVSYVLTTGANWSGPIRDFRLVVDKNDPEAVVSFCADGVKKVAPTRFEVRKKNFMPRQDLNILVVTPMSKEQ